VLRRRPHGEKETQKLNQMRLLVTLIVIATVAFGGWQVYQKHPEYLAGLLPKQPKPAAHKPAAKPVIVAQQSKPAPSPEEEYSSLSKDSSGQPVLSAVPASMPAPEVKAPEAEQPIAEVKPTKMPPGQFLMTQRVSVETRDGISAVVPGDTVKLLERRHDGTMKVTNGKADFIVRKDQVTQDMPPGPIRSSGARADATRSAGL
jgi:hypothetical protein